MGRSGRRKAGVTLKDIAAATGFSANTVSHALADKADISAETKALIRGKAAEMGYVAKSPAGLLRPGAGRVVAILVGDIANPHFSFMAQEVQALLQAKGYVCAIFSTGDRPELERQAIVTAIGQGVAGVVICPAPGGKRNVALLRQHKVPFVMMGRWIKGVDCGRVVCDDTCGGELAARYLLARGHRRILFLSGGRGISSARERRRGYQAALAAAGLPLEPALVKSAPAGIGQCRRLGEVLAAAPPFTAVLAGSDMLAWEAVSALAASGRAVPGDCSVMGFGGIQPRFFCPRRLTSVAPQKNAMARQVVDILLREVATGQPTDRHVALEMRVVEGDTVAPPGPRQP